MKKCINVFFIFLYFPLTLCALVESTIDPKTSLKVTLSTTSPNRIMFEDGAIVDLILDQEKFQSILHQKSGQAFLSPKSEIKEHPTSVTVMTSTGDTQTISVLAEPGPGEIILLKERTNQLSNEEPLSSDYHSGTIDFLNQILSGHIPRGYGTRTLKQNPFPAQKDLAIKKLRLLEGPFEEILILEIANTTKKPKIIEIAQIKKQEDLWAFIANPHLDPREKTLAIISSKKGI